MTEQEIKEELCAYDPRNPDYIKPYGNHKGVYCSCDNCFYGRTRIAEELLKYVSNGTQEFKNDESEELLEEIQDITETEDGDFRCSTCDHVNELIKNR